MAAWLIPTLILAGFFLLGVEVFAPGMIIGAAGVCLLLAAVVLTYASYGLLAGTLVLVLLTVVGMVGFAVWMKLLPRTFIGRKLALASEIGGGSALPTAAVSVGAEGIAVTPLRPSGTVTVHGKRFDAITDGEFIAAGTGVTVQRADSTTLLVRQTSR